MRTSIFVIMLFFCFSCQQGLLPCPKSKKVRAHRLFSHRSSPDAVTASATQPTKAQHFPRSGTSTVKEIKHVDIEEWDCPKPGTRRYMPKNVKENIKRNLDKISADSVSATTTN